MKKNKRRGVSGVVLSPAMTRVQLDRLLDLRRGSRTDRHLTAQQRANLRNSKDGQRWKKEQWS